MTFTAQQNELAQDVFAGQGVNIAQSGLNVDELLGQIGAINPSVNAATQEAELGGQYSEANAFLGQEQLGLQSQGLGAQEGLLNTQYGIQQATLGGQEQLAATQYGLSQQDIAAQRQAQTVNYGNTVQNTQGGLAASGALNTGGSKQTQATNSFQNQQAQAAITRQQQGEQAQYGFQQQQFGLEALGQAAQQQYSLGDIARGQQGLALSSQANGLSLDQTLNQINYGLGQAGLQGQQATDQLYGQVAQGQGQTSTAISGAIGETALLGGGT
jgi:hypothetical protein